MCRPCLLVVAISCQLLPAIGASAIQNAPGAPTPSTTFVIDGSVVLQAESARIHRGRAEVVEQGSFTDGKGVSLKAGLTSNVGSPATEPDLVFNVRASKPGRYVIRTHAATDAQGSKAMRQARSKQRSE